MPGPDPAVPTPPVDVERLQAELESLNDPALNFVHPSVAAEYLEEIIRLHAAVAEKDAEIACLSEQNSKEYQRGYQDHEAAATIQSPTWDNDVVPLRKQLADRDRQIERLRELLDQCIPEIEYAEKQSPSVCHKAGLCDLLALIDAALKGESDA